MIHAIMDEYIYFVYDKLITDIIPRTKSNNINIINNTKITQLDEIIQYIGLMVFGTGLRPYISHFKI